METQSYKLIIETGANESFTARLGNYSGTGTTRETALTSLIQRISGLTNAERKTLWGAGEQTKTAG